MKYWFNGVTSTYQAYFNNGQYRWDVSSSPGYFVSGGTNQNHNIDVRTTWSSASATAWTSGGCGSNGIWYSNQVDITFNRKRMNNRSAVRNQLTAVHELGHAYGLSHSTLGCGTNTQPVMRTSGSWVLQNCGSSAAPYNNDVAGVNAVY